MPALFDPGQDALAAAASARKHLTQYETQLQQEHKRWDHSTWQWMEPIEGEAEVALQLNPQPEKAVMQTGVRCSSAATISTSLSGEIDPYTTSIVSSTSAKPKELVLELRKQTASAKPPQSRSDELWKQVLIKENQKALALAQAAIGHQLTAVRTHLLEGSHRLEDLIIQCGYCVDMVTTLWDIYLMLGISKTWVPKAMTIGEKSLLTLMLIQQWIMLSLAICQELVTLGGRRKSRMFY
ncbi:hypothetical protein B0H10DRAFT_1952558 [Mycena sp. CBHHK59/15]|nr:hypothetical protein B0H10DRAFT_1952558 [Mycena sp. CBHHK59/15]